MKQSARSAANVALLFVKNVVASQLPSREHRMVVYIAAGTFATLTLGAVASGLLCRRAARDESAEGSVVSSSDAARNTNTTAAAAGPQEDSHTAAVGREAEALDPTKRGAGGLEKQGTTTPADRFEAERLEAEKREVERRDAEKREAEQREAERREAEKREAEKREAERREAERREAERREAERREAEKREVERCDAERREAEQREAERREAEKRQAEQRKAEMREAEKREAERREAERREVERREAQTREAERREAAKREAETREAEKREVERLEAERLDAKRREAERREVEMLEAEKREAQTREAERREAEKRQAEQRKAERREAERREAERREEERLEAERCEAERRESEIREAEKRESERSEAERLEVERLEVERLEAEKHETERREAERREAEKREAERREAERREVERREAQTREAERREAEKRQAEQREAERREAERLEAEHPEVERRATVRREAEQHEVEANGNAATPPTIPPSGDRLVRTSSRDVQPPSKVPAIPLPTAHHARFMSEHDYSFFGLAFPQSVVANTDFTPSTPRPRVAFPLATWTFEGPVSDVAIVLEAEQLGAVDPRPLLSDEYESRLLEHISTSMSPQGHRVHVLCSDSATAVLRGSVFDRYTQVVVYSDRSDDPSDAFVATVFSCVRRGVGYSITLMSTSAACENDRFRVAFFNVVGSVDYNERDAPCDDPLGGQVIYTFSHQRRLWSFAVCCGFVEAKPPAHRVGSLVHLAKRDGTASLTVVPVPPRPVALRRDDVVVAGRASGAFFIGSGADGAAVARTAASSNTLSLINPSVVASRVVHHSGVGGATASAIAPEYASRALMFPFFPQFRCHVVEHKFSDDAFAPASSAARLKRLAAASLAAVESGVVSLFVQVGDAGSTLDAPRQLPCAEIQIGQCVLSDVTSLIEEFRAQLSSPPMDDTLSELPARLQLQGVRKGSETALRWTATICGTPIALGSSYVVRYTITVPANGNIADGARAIVTRATMSRPAQVAAIDPLLLEWTQQIRIPNSGPIK